MAFSVTSLITPSFVSRTPDVFSTLQHICTYFHDKYIDVTNLFIKSFVVVYVHNCLLKTALHVSAAVLFLVICSLLRGSLFSFLRIYPTMTLYSNCFLQHPVSYALSFKNIQGSLAPFQSVLEYFSHA
jgi:hypothetical protein